MLTSLQKVNLDFKSSTRTTMTIHTRLDANTRGHERLRTVFIYPDGLRQRFVEVVQCIFFKSL